MASASRDAENILNKTPGPIMAMSQNERQEAYRVRLDAAGKVVIRAVVPKETAARLRRLAHGDVSRHGPVLEKALAALEAVGASDVSSA